MSDELEKPSITAVYDHYGLRILGSPGGWVKAECPMPAHEDRNPSASVNEDVGRWRCHGCGEGGDGYDIIMEREGFARFADSIKFAQGIAGASDSPVRAERGGSSLLPHRSGHRPGRRAWRAPWQGM